MSELKDDKDWTWVLTRPCPECGYDAAAVDLATLGDRVRDGLPRWTEALAAPDAARRPSPDIWSPLEYACHVRDVFGLFAERLHLMLTQDDPAFPNWDQDVTAVESGYATADPLRVSTDLVQAGEAIATLFEQIPATGWPRPGRRSNGSTFTVESLSRYFLHDVEHHLHDITR